MRTWHPLVLIAGDREVAGRPKVVGGTAQGEVQPKEPQVTHVEMSLSDVWLVTHRTGGSLTGQVCHSQNGCVTQDRYVTRIIDMSLV